jgi:hypothetical protein
MPRSVTEIHREATDAMSVPHKFSSLSGSSGGHRNDADGPQHPAAGGVVSESTVVRAKRYRGRSSRLLWSGSMATDAPTGPSRLREEPVGASTSIDPRSCPTEAVDPATRICQMMQDLSRHDQAAVLRRVHQDSVGTAQSDRNVMRPARHWIAGFLALCCAVLVPWTIGLAVTLPRQYLVANWPLAWAGFDVVLLGFLLTTAWALWKQRQLAIPAAMVTSALLLCDAWFDILTAHPGRCLILSLATAMFAELPIAVLLGLTSVELLRRNMDIDRPGEPGSKLQALFRARLPESTST